MGIDWKRKLTSRKFWLAVVAFVTGLMVTFKVDAETVEAVGGLIMSGAAVVAYIIGEGLADAQGAAWSGYVETAQYNKDQQSE